MDVLQFAIDMELDGERYYREQAAKNAGNALHVVFGLLADDEAKHAGILQNRMDGKTYALKPHEQLTRQMSLFAEQEKPDEPENLAPDQADAYHAALQKEQQSIDLYSDLRGKANDAETEALFDFLIQEETMHRHILTEMYHHLNRPREWVEAAEFGVREEY